MWLLFKPLVRLYVAVRRCTCREYKSDPILVRFSYGGMKMTSWSNGAKEIKLISQSCMFECLKERA